MKLVDGDHCPGWGQALLLVLCETMLALRPFLSFQLKVLLRVYLVFCPYRGFLALGS